MFGKKAALGKGGKGKGKGGKGKSGGINFIVGEREEEDSDRDREVDRVASPQPVSLPKPEPKEAAPAAKLDQDLVLSEEDEPAPPLPPIKHRSNGRPSLVFSVPLSRVSRLTALTPSRAQQHRAIKDKKKDRWITKGAEERRDQKPSENSNSEHAPEVRGRSSSRQRNSHRKSADRTLSDSNDTAAAPSDYEKKKRDREFDIDRESSPGFGPSTAKRLREVEEEEEEDNFPANTVPPSFLPGDGVGLMPPPRNHYSYLDRRQVVEELEDEDNEEEAKRLKHEADSEHNLEAKCTKYLQAFLMFIISGVKQEREGETHMAFSIYLQTLTFIKYSMKPIIPRKQAWPPKEKTDVRLLVMSLRAQSLLNLKLYKLKKHDLKENQKTIGEILNKAPDKDEETPQVDQPHISPTPSPAGSEGSNCSKSSGYTSSGEGRINHTPPSMPTVCLIPKHTLQSQYELTAFISQSHELWEQADLFISKGLCEAFFNRLDNENLPLTLHSSLNHLLAYTRKGLEYISQELAATHRSPLNPRSS